MRKLILTAAILGSNLAMVAFADCTIQNVAGTYGYVGVGTTSATNPLGLPPGAYSSVGTLAFDGKGNLLITDTARIDDVILPPTTYPSTYTVDKQCVGTFTITGSGIPGPHFKFVVVDNRKGIRAISLIPGLVVNYVNTTRIESDKKNGQNQGEDNQNRER
jgi:hypothetical protein